MGQIVHQAGITSAELEMPWEKLVRGAALCEGKRQEGVWDVNDKANSNGVSDEVIIKVILIDNWT
jgi:hypothetical protein